MTRGFPLLRREHPNLSILPNIPYVPAAFFKVGRNGLKPRVIVIHTMEFPERDNAAEWCADYFAGGTVVASAHYCIDNDSAVQGVWDSNTAWASPGLQYEAFQLEHAGYAGQSAENWSDDYSTKMLDLSARISAYLCNKFDIEPQRIEGDALRTETGITGHVDVNNVFKKSTHWDPGKNFPWDAYIAAVRHYLGVIRGETAPEVPAPPVKGTPPVVKPAPVKVVYDLGADKTRRVQTILSALGYYSGVIDGVYGPYTAKAVAAYQKAQRFGNLVVDGEWGPKTQSHYNWVRLLQYTMNMWKGGDIRVDGDYGKVTRDRVIDLMRRNKGEAYKGIIDGIPGPVFCKMLGIPTHP